MPDEQPAPQKIDSRSSSLLALGISLWLGAFHVHDLWTHHSPRPHWIDEFHAILPGYTWIALHVLAFCITAFVLVNVVRERRGAERIYFVMFLSGLLIEPLRLLPVAVAMIALYAQTGAALVMLLASVWLLFTLAPKHEQA